MIVAEEDPVFRTLVLILDASLRFGNLRRYPAPACSCNWHASPPLKECEETCDNRDLRHHLPRWSTSPTGPRRTSALTSTLQTGKLLHLGDSVPSGPCTRNRQGRDELIHDLAATRFLPNGVHAGKREQGRGHGRADLPTQAGFDEDVRGGISMAVREAMINAVLHGNAYDPAKRVNSVV